MRVQRQGQAVVVLLYVVHKYRLAGLILFGAGGIVSYLACIVWVP